MWLTIIALLDKVFNIVGILTGWWVKRTDEGQKKRDAAQAAMDAAVKAGDWDAWDRARADRDSAR
jgi:hypothetical protein